MRKLLRIVAPHFVAGVVLDDGRVVETAPILKYMKGWRLRLLYWYAVTHKQWRID